MQSYRTQKIGTSGPTRKAMRRTKTHPIVTFQTQTVAMSKAREEAILCLSVGRTERTRQMTTFESKLFLFHQETFVCRSRYRSRIHSMCEFFYLQWSHVGYTRKFNQRRMRRKTDSGIEKKAVDILNLACFFFFFNDQKKSFHRQN